MSLPRLQAEVSAIVSVSSSLPRTTPSRWFLIPLVMQHGTSVPVLLPFGRTQGLAAPARPRGCGRVRPQDTTHSTLAVTLHERLTILLLPRHTLRSKL